MFNNRQRQFAPPGQYDDDEDHDNDDNRSRNSTSISSSARSLNLLDSDSDDATQRSPSSYDGGRNDDNNNNNNNPCSPSTQTINNLSQESVATDLHYDMSQLDDDVAEAEKAKSKLELEQQKNNEKKKKNNREGGAGAQQNQQQEEEEVSSRSGSIATATATATAAATATAKDVGGSDNANNDVTAIASSTTNTATTRPRPQPRGKSANANNADGENNNNNRSVAPVRQQQRQLSYTSFTPLDEKIATETTPPSPPPAHVEENADPLIIQSSTTTTTSSNRKLVPPTMSSKQQHREKEKDEDGHHRHRSLTFKIDPNHYDVHGVTISSQGVTGVRIARLMEPPENLFLIVEEDTQQQRRRQQQACMLHGLKESCLARQAGLEPGDIFLSIEISSGAPGGEDDEESIAFDADTTALKIRQYGIQNNKLPSYEDVHDIVKGGKRPLVIVVAREKKKKNGSAAATSSSSTTTTTQQKQVVVGNHRRLTPPPTTAAAAAAAVTVTAQRGKGNRNNNNDEQHQETTTRTEAEESQLSLSSKRVSFTLPSSSSAGGGGSGTRGSSSKNNKQTNNNAEGAQQNIHSSSCASTSSTTKSTPNTTTPVLLTTTRAGLRGRFSSSSAYAATAASSQNNNTPTATSAAMSTSIVPFCALCNGRNKNNNNNQQRQRKVQVHHAWCPKQQHFERTGAKDVLERLRLGITKYNCQLCQEAYQNGRWPKKGASTLKHSAACQRAHQQREMEKKRRAKQQQQQAAAIAARKTQASKRKRHDEAPLSLSSSSSSSSSSDSSNDDNGDYKQCSRRLSRQRNTTGLRRGRSRGAAATATKTKNRSRSRYALNNNGLSSSDEDDDEDEYVRGGGRNKAAVGKSSGHTSSSRNKKKSSNAKQTGNKKTKKGRSITPNNGDEDDDNDDEEEEFPRKRNDDDFDPYGNDTGESDLEVAEVEWMPVQHDPWGPQGFQEGDVILFSATNTGGGGGGGASSAQQQLRHHSQHETLLPSPQFVLNPFASYKQYCTTHSTSEEGFHMLELTRDPFATLPWGFSYERHEFGGACLVKSVQPLSPAATAVFFAGESCNDHSNNNPTAGLRVNDMIISLNGKRVGGMTVNGFDIELEISGPVISLVVSRYKFPEQIEQRIHQAERTYLNAVDQALNDERRLGWVDISLGPSHSSRATSAATTTRTDSVATSSSVGFISNNNGLPTLTMNANDDSNSNSNSALLGQHGDSGEGIDSSLAVLASAAAKTAQGGNAAAAQTTTGIDVDNYDDGDDNGDNDEGRNYSTPASPPVGITAMEKQQQQGYSYDDNSSQENDDEMDSGSKRMHAERPNSIAPFDSPYHHHNHSTNEGTVKHVPFVMENGVGQELEPAAGSEGDDVVDDFHNDSDTDSGEGNARLGCVCGVIHGDEIPVFWVQCDCCQSWYNVSSDCIGLSVDDVNNAPSWKCWGCPSSQDDDDDADLTSNHGGAQQQLHQCSPSLLEAAHLDTQQMIGGGSGTRLEEVPTNQNGAGTTTPVTTLVEDQTNASRSNISHSHPHETSLQQVETAATSEEEIPNDHFNSRQWSTDEHERYLAAIATDGPRSWKLIAEAVKTRSVAQVKKHHYDTRKKLPPAQHQHAQSAPTSKSRRRRGVSSLEKKAEEVTLDATQPKVFAEGSIVFIQEHGWANVNNEAGYAKVLRSYQDDEGDLVYDVQYIVGGRANGVEAEFVGPSDLS